MTTYALMLNFADAEVPTISGSQVILAHPPVGGSLQLFRNGLLLASGADYALAGQFALLVAPPDAGDVWLAFYRF